MVRNTPKNIAPEAPPKRKFRLFSFFTQQSADPSMRILPYFLYVAFFGIIYIANTHYAERNIRKINKLKAEVDELRLDYTTLKSEYMLAGKRTEVAKKAARLGIEESNKPPYKLTPKTNFFGNLVIK
jgi:cell division protein FtsL